MNKHIILLSISLLFYIKLVAQDEWLNLELGKVGEITIQLKVKKYACAADTNWIRVEFNNPLKDTLHINKSYYCAIDYNDSVGSSSFSNDDGAVISEFLEPYGEYTLLPGITSYYKSLSNVGSFHFGLPENTKDTLPINCNLRFSFTLKGYPPFEVKNYQFTFYWYHPSDEQVKFISQRLETIISEHDSKRGPSEHYFYYMVLKNPRIAFTIPLQRYITYLGILDNESWVGYRTITIEYIDENYYSDTIAINYS